MCKDGFISQFVVNETVTSSGFASSRHFCASRLVENEASEDTSAEFSHNRTSLFFFVTKHHLKGVQYKELAFLHPFEIENNCVADGRYKVFLGEFVRIKVCVDSCWAEIVSAAATSCTTLIMVQIWLMVEVQEWEEDERSRRRRLIGIIEVRRSSTTGKIDQKKKEKKRPPQETVGLCKANEKEKNIVQ